MSMKKKYLYPQVIVMPCYGLSALCVSGEVQNSLGGGGENNGGNPWEGRAPRRTAPF